MDASAANPLLTLSYNNPQVQFVLWGDSHLANNHFFPDEFHKLISLQGSRYCPNLINNAVGGKRLNQGLIDQIETFVQNQQTSQFYFHIVFVGGNNIRDCFRGTANLSNKSFQASQTVDYLIWGHKEILQKIKLHGKTKALFISPLPSAHLEHEIHFETLSNKLHTLAHENGAYFVPVRESLSSENGLDQNGIMQRIYRQEFFHDDVHLNIVGAKILAKRVFSVISTIPNSVFGYKKLSKNRRL